MEACFISKDMFAQHFVWLLLFWHKLFDKLLPFVLNSIDISFYKCWVPRFLNPENEKVGLTNLHYLWTCFVNLSSRLLITVLRWVFILYLAMSLKIRKFVTAPKRSVLVCRLTMDRYCTIMNQWIDTAPSGITCLDSDSESFFMSKLKALYIYWNKITNVAPLHLFW